jgi:hypothetical protein
MILRASAMLAMLLAIPQAPAPVPGQSAGGTGANAQMAPPSTSPIAPPQVTTSPNAPSDCDGVPCDYPQPRITVANPPPTPATSWPLRDRVSWAASIVLAIVGYFGVILAVSTLKKIERLTQSTEAAAEAAAEAAKAALLNAQAVIDSGRPWLLMTIEPSRTVENSFTVRASNRGRCPANVIASVEQIRIAADEAHLPTSPEYDATRPGIPFTPVILLPGESMVIKSLGRDDMKTLCKTEEAFKRIENWEDKVYLYGKVTYLDLIAPADKQTHETRWCCWYIHGRQKSGLVAAGPPEYNLHT